MSRAWSRRSGRVSRASRRAMRCCGNPTTASYAEYALSRPQMVVPKPPGLAWEIAGSLGVVTGTAYATLEALKLGTGETLLILGSSGGVGSLATQLAVARGVRVVGTAGPSKLEQVRALGATPVAYGDGLAERLREAAAEGRRRRPRLLGPRRDRGGRRGQRERGSRADDRLLAAGERPRRPVPRGRRRRADAARRSGRRSR